MSIHAIIVKSKVQLPCLRPIDAFPKSIHPSSWEGALLPLRKVEYNSSDNKKYIILKFEWKMGDKCGVFRENSTEFQSNNGKKDASNTFIESGKCAGEEAQANDASDCISDRWGTNHSDDEAGFLENRSLVK